MLKIRQDLTLQQSLKHPGLVSRFHHGHQVLTLTEGHHSLDPVLWASILEASKLSRVLGASSWVVWIHEEIQLDPTILVRVRPITLSIFFILELKEIGGRVLSHRKRQRSGGFGKLTHGHCLD
jgi:hypothetical protein